jgi:hypothetical protein
MANFNTHLLIGALASGLAATMTMAADVVPQSDILGLTVVGVVGSILPDVDLENTEPSKLLFGGLGMALAFATLFHFHGTYSIAELWAVWLGVFLIIRYGVFWTFHKRTRHRGIFHSLLAAAFFAALTAAIFSHIFLKDPLVAWFAGLFMFGGYVVHLVLDEIYAVNYEGMRLKSSFGTALKPVDHHSWPATGLMASALVAAVLLAPPSGSFFHVVSTHNVHAFLAERLLPKDGWFRSLGQERINLAPMTKVD